MGTRSCYSESHLYQKGSGTVRAGIWLQIEGNQADEGELDLVDAAAVLEGFAVSLNIVGHAFVHDNAVRNRVPIRNDFATSFTAAKKGCFELQMDISFGETAIAHHGSSVIIARFWDYLSLSMAVAVGVNYEPLTPWGVNLNAEEPFIFDDIASNIEAHLLEVHRPIWSKSAQTVKLVRPKVGEKLVLNRDTLDYISVSDVSPDLEYLVGNVTKYNILTGRGRAYFKKYGRTVPFFIKDILGAGHQSHLQATESMREAAVAGLREGGQRLFGIYAVTGSRDQVKRVTVEGISELPNG